MPKKKNKIKIYRGVAHIIVDKIFSRIDYGDVQRVSRIHWSFDGNYLYNQKMGKLSRFLIGAKKGEQVDHINNDKLDNRKKNLRIATHQQNIWNKKKAHKNNKLGVRGVQFFKKTYPNNNVPTNRPYLARINVGGKYIHLGYFSKLEDAKSARMKAEQKYHGEFASCHGKKIKDVKKVLKNESIDLRKMNKNNKTGFRGTYVIKYKSGNKFCANIWLKINGNMKHVHLGSFKTLEDAKSAREKAEKKYWR